MKEIQDLIDALPYWLIFVLSVFIALSPYNPVCEASSIDFPVHRLAQYDLSGNRFGSKMAAISIEAKTVNASLSNILRKIVVCRMQDMSITRINEFFDAGAGGVLMILPRDLHSVPEVIRQAIMDLEQHLLNSEIEVPVYFAEHSELTEELLDNLYGLGNEQSSTAAQALVASIASNGYQLVSSTSATPSMLADPIFTTLESVLRGKSDEDVVPTVVVLAHYDSMSAAPGLAFGADSNGSGVTILLELARIFGKLYSDPKTRPAYNLAFLLTAGGKWNYFGAKKWLEDHLDQTANSELLSDLKFAVCLDSLGNDRGVGVNMHVSKRPKEDSAVARFFANLQKLATQFGTSAELIHKKINLADDVFAWEHERFSVRRITAFTLSSIDAPSHQDRTTILDRSVDVSTIQNNVRLLAETLACTLYSNEECMGQLFFGSLAPQKEAIQAWTELWARTPRYAGILSQATKSGEPSVVDLLAQALKSYTHDIRFIKSKLDRQDPEFSFYDTQLGVRMTAHLVKPAVFDLLLTMAIASYLGLVYLIIVKAHFLVTYLSTLFKVDKAKSNGSLSNGHTKVH